MVFFIRAQYQSLLNLGVMTMSDFLFFLKVSKYSRYLDICPFGGLLLKVKLLSTFASTNAKWLFSLSVNNKSGIIPPHLDVSISDEENNGYSESTISDERISSFAQESFLLV